MQEYTSSLCLECTRKTPSYQVYYSLSNGTEKYTLIITTNLQKDIKYIEKLSL